VAEPLRSESDVDALLGTLDDLQSGLNDGVEKERGSSPAAATARSATTASEPAPPLLQLLRSELTDFRRRIRSDLERGLVQLLKLERKSSETRASRMQQEMQRIVGDALAIRSETQNDLGAALTAAVAAAAEASVRQNFAEQQTAQHTLWHSSLAEWSQSLTTGALTADQLDEALSGLEARLLNDRQATVSPERAADPGPPPLTAVDLDRALESIECRILARIDSVTSAIQQLPASTQPLQAAVSDHSASSTTASAAEVASGAEPTAASANRQFKQHVKPGTGVRSWEEIKKEIMRAEGLGMAEDSGTSTPERPAREPIAVSALGDSAILGTTSQIRDDAGRPTFADHPAPEPAPELPALNPLSSDRHFRLPEQDPLLELPAVPDVDQLNLSELRDAFRQREDFISTLIARLRRQQEATTLIMSAEQLRQLVEHLPDELSLQVRSTLRQMNELARLSELELSLERARIARQVSQMEHSRQILEHNARQLGMKLNDDGSVATSRGAGARDSSSRRWLGKLGFGQ
jgi:hypothetical protein